jgi:hypothetical protein
MPPRIGGMGVGTATATVLINTHQMRGAAATARQVGNQIATGLNRGTGAVDNQAKSWRQLQFVMAGVAAATTAVFATGFKAAAYFQEQGIALKAMAGGFRESLVLQEKMRTAAFRMGVPFADMVEATRILLPTLEGNTAELDKQWQIVRRVSALNPGQGIAGAAFAVNEALVSGGSDLMSLAERFNLSRQTMREEMRNANNDFWQALDKTLERMGITQQMASELGTTFSASFKVARDSAVQLLAEGFTPMIETMAPLLQMAAQFMAEMRESHSEVLGIGAAMVTVAAAAVPLVFLAKRLADVVKVIAPGFMRIVPFLSAAVAVVGAANLAMQGVRAVGRNTGNEAMADYNFRQAAIDFAKALFIVQFYLTKMGVEVYKVVMQTIANWSFGVMNVLKGLATFQATLAGFLPTQTLRDRATASAGDSAMAAFGLMSAGMKALQEVGKAEERFQVVQAAILRGGRAIGNALNFAAGSITGAGSGGGSGFGPRPEFNAKQTGIMVEFYESIVALDDKYAAERLDATRDFEEQRSDTVRSYEQQIAREAADFGRERARAIRQYEGEVADAITESQERQAQWQEDFDDQMREIREDSNEQLAEMERDYQKDRENRLRDHQDKLFDAASRLDARAVAEEQRRFARESREAEENYREKVAKEENNRDEQLAKEQAEFDKRVARAAEEDAKRLQSMEEDFRDRLALEDEDRAIRQAREAEDHAMALAAQAAQHTKRLDQIAQQQQAERTALEAEFRQRLYAENLYTDEWLAVQKDRQEKSIEFFKLFFRDIIESAKLALRESNRGATDAAGREALDPQTMTPFARGGFVTRTGAALVHAGETIIPSNRRGGFGNSLSIESGGIAIYASPGMDANEVGQVVMERLSQFWERLHT